jgi:hypothetical protein
VLAHFDDLRRMDDLQLLLDPAQIALCAQGGSDVGFAPNELDVVTPGARRAHSPGYGRHGRVIATHGIQRDAHHALRHY